MLLNLMLIKRILKQFVIVNVFVCRLGGPIDARHGDGIGEDVFSELAGHGASAGLFDFSEVEVEEIVEEVEDFFAGGEVGSVHHSFRGGRKSFFPWISISSRCNGLS